MERGSMIKILFFLPSLTGGGAERTIVNIANGLDRSKYKVHLLLLDRPTEGKYKDEYSHLLYEDICVHNLKIKICKKNYLRLLLGMRKVIKDIGPDIAMSTMLRPNIMLTIALKLSGFQGKTVLRESNNRTATKIRWIERKAIRYIYGRFADKAVALSEGVKLDLCKNYEVPPNRIQVIYNPIDLKAIEALSKDVVDLSGENKLISAGRFTEQKDYPTLLKALSILRNQVNFRMIILGKGELESQIKEIIKNEDLEQYITLIGFQANPYKYIHNSDIFILSSAWEGFGHVIVEAMACGAVVISTDCPYGPSEIITDHVNGILVPVGDYQGIADAVVEVLQDINLREKIRSNALKRAQDFERDKIVKQYEDMFENIMILS